MSEDDLYSRLIGWLRLRSGLSVIIRDRLGQPRPSGVYGMVNLIRGEALNGPSEIEYTDNPLFTPLALSTSPEPHFQVPVVAWEWTFSFNVYAPSAVDYIRKVANAAMINIGLEPLLPLTVNRVSAIRRIPELINQVWEDRCQIDLFIHGLARDGVSVDVIETVDPAWSGNLNVAAPGDNTGWKSIPSPPIVKPPSP